MVVHSAFQANIIELLSHTVLHWHTLSKCEYLYIVKSWRIVILVTNKITRRTIKT